MNFENECYAQALKELRGNTLDEATYARAFADGLGDAEKTNALYVKYRATALIKQLSEEEYRKREYYRIAEESKEIPGAKPVRIEDITVPQANRITAAILAIMFGWLGGHKIYMGKFWPAMTMGGMFFIGLLMAGVPSLAIVLLSIYEAVCYFSMSDEEFHRKYMLGRQNWF